LDIIYEKQLLHDPGIAHRVDFNVAVTIREFANFNIWFKNIGKIGGNKMHGLRHRVIDKNDMIEQD